MAETRKHAEGCGTTFTVYTGDVAEVELSALVSCWRTNQPAEDWGSGDSALPQRRLPPASSLTVFRMGADRHPGVDAYIAGLPAWQAAICREVRELVHSADPEIEETIKRTVQPYFVCRGNVCALLATKDHVNVFIYDPDVPDPDGLINQGHGNATARSIQVYEGEPINASALTSLIRAVVDRNRRGGWRKLAGR